MHIHKALFVGLAVAAVSVTALAAAKVAVVSQQGRAFSVTSLRILKGDSVRFSNEDKFVHQMYVEASSFNFESDEQEPGTDVAIEFPKAGLFEVRCHIHPKMLLQVDVH